MASPLAIGLCSGAAAQTLPAHPTIVTGAASVQQSGAAMTVTQTTPRAILNWDGFSIGTGASVTFNQPGASSAILNRVTGSTPTTIAGQLDANGQVYLVNPNGIAITRGGAVQVGGGFVASTLGIKNSDFEAGNLDFNGAGASAPVDVAGSIRSAPGGFVGLLGGSVSVSGDVAVPLGRFGAASGESAALNLTGDNFLQVAAPTGATTSDGKALIDVTGKVRAGSVAMKAATVASAVREAINIPGAVSATSAHARGGSIILGGGAGGDVAVSGRLNASGRKGGGAITATGRNVTLSHARLAANSAKGAGGTITVTGSGAVTLANSTVSANGATRGGALRIGGDFHGAADVESAQEVTIDALSRLSADATAKGDGGAIAVWSQGLTSFAGVLSAHGGTLGGNGGDAEVSADPATHGVLAFAGRADLSAPAGALGGLLLDPYDITISTGSNSPAGSVFVGGVYRPAGTSILNNGTLEGLLASANVTVSTGGAASAGSDAGNITVAAPILWDTSSQLTLTAAGQIFLHAPIDGGPLVLNAGGNILETSAGYIDATSLSATSATGAVVLTGANTISADGSGDVSGLVSGSAPGGFSLANNAAITVGPAGITSSAGTVYLETDFDGSTRDQSIRQIGPIVAQGLYAVTGNSSISSDVVLTNSSNSVGTLSGGVGSSDSSGYGAFSYRGARASTAIGPVPYLVSDGMYDTPDAATSSHSPALAAGSVSIVNTGGDLVLNGPLSIEDYYGVTTILAASGAFINNVGSGAIVSYMSNWNIYSSSPAADTFGGLDSGHTAVWDTTYPASGSLPAGNRYIFAFQPTLTVTASDRTKAYGVDATSTIASDYVISGLQPAVTGAYQADLAAAVYSGAPSVTSAGSAATASVSHVASASPYVAAASTPYAIDVSQGGLTLAAGAGYKPAYVGAQLRVTPLELGWSVADANSTYGTAATPGAATLTGLVNGDTPTAAVSAFPAGAGAPPPGSPIALAANTPAGTYSELITSLSSSNYVLSGDGTPGVLTISPREVTWSVADAHGYYGVTATPGAATFPGALPGDAMSPTIGIFSGESEIALTPTTPVGSYAEIVLGIGNPNYILGESGTQGTLTIDRALPHDPGHLPGLTMIPGPTGGSLDVGALELQLGAGAGACQAGDLPDPRRFHDPKAALQALSAGMEKLFQSCSHVTPATIADALDTFAARLEILAPQLPPQLRTLPSIIADAARRIRAARTPGEAVSAVVAAIAQVHKAIALLRVENPDNATATAVGLSVDHTLDAARVSLLRASAI